VQEQNPQLLNLRTGTSEQRRAAPTNTK